MAKEVSKTNEGAVATPQQTGIKGVSSFLNSDTIKSKFNEVLGQRGPSFIASVLAACNLSEDLKKCTPESIYTASLMAATLDLPVNPNLGFAYLIPFKKNVGKPNEIVECSFQVGAKGFKQLAQRTGKYLKISDAKVYEGQLIVEDPLEGYKFDWKAKKSDTIIGYVSFFRLVNGFESTFYMTVKDMKDHALRYSQTFKSKVQWVRDSSKWTTDFDAMALKTVTKLNISKNGPLSIEMEKALVTDQAVIKDADTLDVEYEDNKPEPPVNKEEERMKLLIDEASTIEELQSLAPDVELELQSYYKEKEYILLNQQK